MKKILLIGLLLTGCGPDVGTVSKMALNSCVNGCRVNGGVKKLEAQDFATYKTYAGGNRVRNKVKCTCENDAVFNFIDMVEK